MASQEVETVEVTSRSQWRDWLSKNHQRAEGVWLVVFKKSQGAAHVPVEEVIEEALCFGWIDSKTRALDDARSMYWMAPRKPKTAWSRWNKLRVERLIAEGLMAEAGLMKVKEAQADGSWRALDEVEAGVIPNDLEAAFARWPGSKGNFQAFPRSSRRAILEWILHAKRPETRARRVEETARLAASNQRANEWKRGDRP